MPSGLPGDGHADLVAAAHVVLLRRELVAMDGFARRAADRLLELEAGQRRALVLVVLERQIEQPEILPPRGLLLAAMPLEQLRHEPARLLLLVALGGVDRARRASSALMTRCVSSAASAICSLASPELELGPRQLVAVRALGRGAQLLEPVA